MGRNNTIEKRKEIQQDLQSKENINKNNILLEFNENLNKIENEYENYFQNKFNKKNKLKSKEKDINKNKNKLKEIEKAGVFKIQELDYTITLILVDEYLNKKQFTIIFPDSKLGSSPYLNPLKSYIQDSIFIINFEIYYLDLEIGNLNRIDYIESKTTKEFKIKLPTNYQYKIIENEKNLPDLLEYNIKIV